jgi:hypothetical protein
LVYLPLSPGKAKGLPMGKEEKLLINQSFIKTEGEKAKGRLGSKETECGKKGLSEMLDSAAKR